jgi:hypothetical protein
MARRALLSALSVPLAVYGEARTEHASAPPPLDPLTLKVGDRAAYPPGSLPPGGKVVCTRGSVGGEWRHLLVAAAALLVLLMATACAIGGGPNQRATAAQTSIGTNRTLIGVGERTALELSFRPSAGTGLVARFSLRCDRDARLLALAARACQALAQSEETFLPASGLVCPLPTGVLTLTVEGTIGGNHVDRFYPPCSRPERTAIAAWMSLLRFRPGVL